MNANATANLVGITGIARRLVLDGHLAEADARKALDEATKAKQPVHRYLLDKKLATAVLEEDVNRAKALGCGISQTCESPC